MKSVILKKNIYLYQENIIKLIKYWVGDKRVLTILKEHDIEIAFFVKNYAISIIDYYIEVVREEKYIGDCPAVIELLDYLKYKNITSSELFIICISFKNALIEFTYELEMQSLEIEKEINYIFEENFSGILNKYSKSIMDVEKELTKSSNIIDKYVMMSRTSPDGEILSVSRAFCEVSGYSEKELLGKNHNILRHPDMSKELYDNLWETIKKAKVWRGEIKNKKKDGGYYWVDITITPTTNRQGKIIYFDAIRHDITSKKDLEEQQNMLIEQSKSAAMGEMISMIAHQWRQPLQAVSILVQKLPITKMMDGEISDELLEHTVDEIGVQLDYMSKTIDDFRDFFLPDKPKEEIEASRIIDKVLDFLAFLFQSKSVNINKDIKEDPIVSVHINELVQVLINIIKNAIDAMDEKKIENKTINITVSSEKSIVIIEIEDNAKGIDEKIMPKIFEPYFSTKTDKNGTGLGLYMCKTIIEKHSSGELSVSNSKNGAKFKIKLPIS